LKNLGKKKPKTIVLTRVHGTTTPALSYGGHKIVRSRVPRVKKRGHRNETSTLHKTYRQNGEKAEKEENKK